MTTNLIQFSSTTNQLIREKLILKSMIGWAKSRFSAPLKIVYPNDTIKMLNFLQSALLVERNAWISNDDAILIKKNATLFRKVASKFMETLLPSNVCVHYGDVSFDVNRAVSTVSVNFLPTTFLMDSEVRPLIPCMMLVVNRHDIVKKYKDTDSYIGKDHIDVIPLLKMHIDALLTYEEHRMIDDLFDEYKSYTECIESKEAEEFKIEEEQVNLQGIVEALMDAGDGMQHCKAALCMYNLVDTAYRNESYRIRKIKFERDGAIPVKDFCMGFAIRSDTIDLLPLSVILQKLVQNNIERDIKILVGPKYDTIIFHTGKTSTIDPTMVNCFWSSDQEIDYVFNTLVAPRISLETCYMILEEVVKLNLGDSISV